MWDPAPYLAKTQTRMRAPMGWVIGDAPDSEGTGLSRQVRGKLVGGNRSAKRTKKGVSGAFPAQPQLAGGAPK